MWEWKNHKKDDERYKSNDTNDLAIAYKKE